MYQFYCNCSCGFHDCQKGDGRRNGREKVKRTNNYSNNPEISVFISSKNPDTNVFQMASAIEGVILNNPSGVPKTLFPLPD